MSVHRPIDIKGIKRHELLAALYNGTKALGMGKFHDIGEMTPEIAKEYLENRFHGEDFNSFDYVYGRPLKCSFRGNELHGWGLYDRDAGDGEAQRIVDQLKADR